MGIDYKKDGQPNLFPEDEENTLTDVAEDEATVFASGGGTGGVRQFSALPPLPDGDEVPIALYAERAYLEYAISVVKGRALPDVCDGQKPVQRRILFAMRQMVLMSSESNMLRLITVYAF